MDMKLENASTIDKKISSFAQALMETLNLLVDHQYRTLSDHNYILIVRCFERLGD